MCCCCYCSPVACCTLWCCVAVVINWIQLANFNGIIWALEVIEGRIEWQTSAHPQEHAGAQSIARCPEIVFAVASILQILCHRLYFFFCFEWCQLQAQRSTILIGKEIVELWWIWIHSANEILDTVQLNRCNALTCRVKFQRKPKRILLDDILYGNDKGITNGMQRIIRISIQIDCFINYQIHDWKLCNFMLLCCYRYALKTDTWRLSTNQNTINRIDCVSGIGIIT